MQTTVLSQTVILLAYQQFVSVQRIFDIHKLLYSDTLVRSCSLKSPYPSFGFVRGGRYDELELGLIWLGRKCSQNQNIVSEIYLLEGGFATEVVYNNELKRKLFQEQQTIVLSNSVFGITDEWNPLASRTFPTTKKELQNKKLLEECWRKNYSNNDTYLLIPKSYEFMRENLMVVSMIFRLKL